MLKLTIGNKVAALSEGTSVRITRGNTVMNGTDAYTLPFELDLSDPRNTLAIKHLNNLRAIGDRRDMFDSKLYYNKNILLDGALKILSLKKAGSFTLFGNNKELLEKAKLFSFSDFEWEKINAFNSATRTLDGVMAELQSTLDGSKDYVAFELLDYAIANKYLAFSHAPLGIFNRYSHSSDYGFFNELGGGYAGGYKYCNTIFLRVGVVIDRLMASLGYEVNTNIFNTDAYKDMVVLNSNNLWATSGAVDYTYFLPSCTVYDFLNAFISSGFVFDVDSSRKSVSIYTPNDYFGFNKSTVKNIVDDSIQTIIEDNDGYAISMSSNSEFSTGSFLNDSEDDYTYLTEEIIPTQSVNMKTDLPSVSTLEEGDIYFVRAEGMFFQIQDISDSLEWVRIKSLISPLVEGDESNTVSSLLSIPKSITVRDHETLPYYKQRLVINTDNGSTDDVVVTMYRGLCYAQYLEELDSLLYPHANPQAYLPDGTAIADEISINISLLYEIQSKKLNLLSTGVKVEYEIKGNIGDVTLSSFPPFILEGQLALLKSRYAKVTGREKEIIITNTAYVEQTLDE